jgi:signal recognition particle subunit SRP72
VRTLHNSINQFCELITFPSSVLRIEPNDKDALQTKLFVLLQTEQYEAALSLISTGDKSSDSEYAFERTYSLYRVQHEQEAAEGLKGLKEENNAENERAVLHLEAQLVSHLASMGHSWSVTNIRVIGLPSRVL